VLQDGSIETICVKYILSFAVKNLWHIPTLDDRSLISILVDLQRKSKKRGEIAPSPFLFFYPAFPNKNPGSSGKGPKEASCITASVKKKTKYVYGRDQGYKQLDRSRASMKPTFPNLDSFFQLV